MDPTVVSEYPLEQKHLSRRQRNWLLAAAALSSSCGLAVELLLGTLASYLVGNQALAYGVAVGGFLAAMGLGAYFSRFIAPSGPENQEWVQLQVAFIWVELLIAPLSALIPLGLFALFVIDGPFWIALFLATVLLGMLAGMELPILTRLLERDQGVRNALAGVLALDYLGALLGSLGLPVVLLPLLGLFPSAVLIGIIPAVMVIGLARLFPAIRQFGRWGFAIALGLLVFLPLTIPLGDRLENTLYKAPIITRIQSPYQHIVLTRQGTDLRLFLDGDLQFSSLDEYRYHEALVHPAISADFSQSNIQHPTSNIQHPRHVLLLGAGDGLALREVLKWPQVERVVLIDLDQAVVNLARRQPFLVRANANAYGDRRVQVIQADAFVTAPKLPETFDVIIADFPDPDRDVLAKLYAQGFYQRLLSRLAPDGVFVTQASSPFFAPRAFACIAATLKSVGLFTYPYVVDVPSFGLWGFVMASRNPVALTNLQLPVATRFLDKQLLRNLFYLPKDIDLGNVEVNRLSNPVILKYQTDPRWTAYD
jgi:spermidine synthase